MPKYAALARNNLTGAVEIIPNGPGKGVCLAWMRAMNQWGIPPDYTPLAGLANIAGEDRVTWVSMLREIPEMKDYILIHEDWQVLPIEWTWQEILWAYSGVRQVWENPSSVVSALQLREMGYSARDAWYLGLTYRSRGGYGDPVGEEEPWYHTSISTGHNCVPSESVPYALPRSIRSALKTAREIGQPFRAGLQDDGDGISPMGDLGEVYNLVRQGNKECGDLPNRFVPKRGGELDEGFLRYMR